VLYFYEVEGETMNLRFSASDLAFREQVRAFFRQHLPDDIRLKTLNSEALARNDIMRWHSILHKRGWVAPNWPKEYDTVWAWHVRPSIDGFWDRASKELPPTTYPFR